MDIYYKFKLRVCGLLALFHLFACSTSHSSFFTHLLPQSMFRDSLLETVLKNITCKYFRDSRQVLVFMPNHLEHSLNYLPCPRLMFSAAKTQIPGSSGEDDGLLLFVEDDSPLSNMFDSIPRTWYPAHFVIVIRDSSKLEEVCRRLSQIEAYNMVVLFPSTKDLSMNIYTLWPYRKYRRCGDWTPFKIAEGYQFSELFPSKTKNMQGCPVRLVALGLAPNVIYHGQAKDGVEVRLLGAIAEKMNFTTMYLPLSGGHWGRVRADGGLEGMIGDIHHNRSDLGFGLVTHNLQVLHLFDYTLSFGGECLAWGVPLGAGHNVPVWTTLTMEFSVSTWIFIISLLMLSAVVFKVLPDNKLFNSSRFVLWYVCSSLVAVPVTFQPRSTPLRSFVATWLLYCIVVNIAYQAELGSIVTVPWAAADIHDLNELLQSGLHLYAPYKLRDQLGLSYRDDDLSRRMVDKMIPGRDIEQFIKRLQQQDPDIAYLLYRRTLQHYASQSGWKFHVVTSNCILYAPITMVLRRGSPLTSPINMLLGQFYETGFLHHWNELFTPRCRIKEKPNMGLALEHMFAAFMLLTFGLLTASTVFLVELLIIYKHHTSEDNLTYTSSSP